MNVNTLTDRTIINWQGFSIGAGETANFIQPGASSAVLNRVTALNNPSLINGALNSNGNVIVVNPSGVMVGSTGVINTNGFTASVLDLPNNEFLQGGPLNFRGDSTASVINEGMIKTGSGGAALIGGDVVNTGVITSDGGSISLATGGSVTLADGSRFTHADLATIEAGLSPYAGVIQNSGTIRATGAIETGGEVFLVNPGGNIMHDGTIAAYRSSASGQIGGDVTVEANDIQLAGAEIDVSGAAGGGRVNVGGGFQGKDPSITNAATTSVDADSVIKADAIDNGNGGQVVVWSDEETDFAGTITAQGGANGGDGGLVEVSGLKLRFDGLVNTSAPQGNTGWLLLDPVGIAIVPDMTDGGTDPPLPGTDPVLTLSDERLNLFLLDNNITLATSPATDEVVAIAEFPSGRTVPGAHDDNIVVAAGTAVDTTGNTLYFSTGTVDLYADITGDVGGGADSNATLPASFGPLRSPTEVNVYETASIQDGVDIVAAGGQVNVGDGTFAGGVSVGKALTLQGDGPTNTTVIEVASNSAGITVSSSNVTIDGFRFERDGNASNATGILLDGRFASNGPISNILIGDDADADAIGNYFVDLLNVGILALGDVNDVEISNNVFGLNNGAPGDLADPDRIRRGIVGRVERSGNSVIDGLGNVLDDSDNGPLNDWLIDNNQFALRSFASTQGTAIDLQGASGTSSSSRFVISNNEIENSTFGILVGGAGGPGSGSPYPVSRYIDIADNTVNGITDRGEGLRIGAARSGNDRFLMSDVNISGNEVNNTRTAINVTGVTFAQMSDVVIDDNVVDGASRVGIRLNIAGRLRGSGPDWTGFVISNNDVDLDASGIGMQVTYGLNSELTIGSGNSLSGGVDGLVINGRSGRMLSLVGDTIDNTSFSGQSGDYIRLEDTALFDPGAPTVIDIRDATFEGQQVSAMTLAEALATEDKLVHYLDNPTLGLLDSGVIVVPDGSSIQLAVNAAGMLPSPQTVNVGAGTFGGSVEAWVDDLTLLGQGDTTIIDTDLVDPFANNGDRDNGFEVTTLSSIAPGLVVDNLAIDGFRFVGTGSQIGIEAGASGGLFSPTANNLTIADSSFDGLQDGIVAHRIGALTLAPTTTTISNVSMANIGDRGIDVRSDLRGDTVIIENSDIDSGGDAIRFSGSLLGSTATIAGNDSLIGGGEAILFSDTVTASNIRIVDNTEISGAGNGILFDDTIQDFLIFPSEITITGNELITGDNDAIGFNGVIDESIVNISGNDRIRGDEDGINVNEIIDSSFTVAGNRRVRGRDGSGIEFDGLIDDGSEIEVASNERIRGGDFGIEFDDPINASMVDIEDNQEIIGDDISGISFDEELSDAQIRIVANQDVMGGDFGIAFNDLIDSSSVRIARNETIEGEDRVGIMVDGDLDESRIVIRNNQDILGRNNGIRFDNPIDDSRVRIIANERIMGDRQSGVVFHRGISDSRIDVLRNDNIRGDEFGIEFRRAVGESLVEFDGNGTIRGNNTAGISFQRSIVDSQINVTDNDRIRGGDDGIELEGVVDSEVLIIQNELIRGDGISGVGIYDDVVGSRVVIARNDRIRGDDFGILFDGVVDDSAIRVNRNDAIRGFNEAGVAFLGLVNDASVRINRNDVRGGNDAVLFGGPVDDVNMRMIDNDLVGVDRDGISFERSIGEDSRVLIAGNRIRADQTGIDIWSIEDDALVAMIDNTILVTGDGSGIRLEGVDSSLPVLIAGGSTTGGAFGLNVIQGNEIPLDGHVIVSGLEVNDASDTGISFRTFLEDHQLEVTLLNQVTINGGAGLNSVGMVFDGPGMSLTGDTLADTRFVGTPGNFIELRNGGLFEPGRPTLIDGTGVFWSGLDPGIPAQRQVIINRIVDFIDQPTLGLIFPGAGPPADQTYDRFTRYDDYFRTIGALMGPYSSGSITYPTPTVEVDEGLGEGD